MNQKSFLYTVMVSIFLIACSGSDQYRGEWNAINNSGEPLELVFGKKDLTIIEADTIKHYRYSQNSYTNLNYVKTYGIRLDDGRSFQVHFPVAKDNSRGAILDANNQPIFLISREEMPSYDKLYGL